MNLRSLLFTSLLASGATLAWAAPANACSCIEQTVAEAYSAADLVVEIRVTSVQPSSGTNVRVELEVLRTFKGTSVASIVFQADTNRMCLPSFPIGARRILYFEGTPTHPEMRDCARVASSQLAGERRALRRLQRRP